MEMIDDEDKLFRKGLEKGERKGLQEQWKTWGDRYSKQKLFEEIMYPTYSSKGVGRGL